MKNNHLAVVIIDQKIVRQQSCRGQTNKNENENDNKDNNNNTRDLQSSNKGLIYTTMISP
jgi:hypothetical protein